MPLSVSHLNLVVPGADRLRARLHKLPVFCKLAKYRSATPRAYDSKCIAKLSHKDPLCVLDMTNPHWVCDSTKPRSVCDMTKHFGSALPSSVLLELFRINRRTGSQASVTGDRSVSSWNLVLWSNKQAHYFHLNLPLSHIMRSNGRKLLMSSEPLREHAPNERTSQNLFLGCLDKRRTPDSL